MNRINWSKFGLIFSVIFWCFITLIRVFNHSPWYDEYHAWQIAHDLNVFELFSFLKEEGHTFIWFLLLMPFAKTNFMYPYSMLLLNWVFCFIAILILWTKSPFNNWVKFLISFSFPFLGLYSVLARCYSIGIMLLFILISLDKDKLKYPIWYSLLLILLANTSLMGTVPATVLGVRFAFEIFKNKQKIFVPFSIAIFGAVLILVQLIGSPEAGLSFYPEKITLFNVLPARITLDSFWVWSFYSVLTLIFLIIFYVKNKIFPVFFIFSILMLVGIFCIYFGSLWHLFFIYIYLIASCWLVLQRENLKWKNVLIIALIIITIPCFIYKPIFKDYNVVFKNNIGTVANEIKTDKNLNGSTIMIFRQFDTAIQPYLQKNNINIVNYCSGELLNYNTTSYVNSKNCLLNMFLESQMVSLDNSVFDKWYSDNLYLLTLNKIKLNDNNSNKFKYDFILYKDLGENYLWKVRKIK